jgi:hypothetical protein
MEEAPHHIENSLVKLFCDTVELQCVCRGGSMLNALLSKYLAISVERYLGVAAWVM